MISDNDMGNYPCTTETCITREGGDNPTVSGSNLTIVTQPVSGYRTMTEQSLLGVNSYMNHGDF